MGCIGLIINTLNRELLRNFLSNSLLLFCFAFYLCSRFPIVVSLIKNLIYAKQDFRNCRHCDK